MRKLIVFIVLSFMPLLASANTQGTNENSDQNFNAIETPLTFEAVSGTVTVTINNYYCSNTPTIQYRVDDGPWTSLKLSHTECYGSPYYKNPIPAGKIVQIRSYSSTTWWGALDKHNDGLDIACDVDCYVYGNVLSIARLDYATNYETSTKFNYLFYGNTHIKNHPEKALVLPSTTLTAGCYESMFEGCTGLTSAPVLPATDLNVNACYQNMFKGCKNLNFVACPATSVTGTDATTGWLSDVSATGTFVKPASMTSWERSGNGIPVGWNVEDEGSGAKKCATPTISLKDGKIVFDCETEAVEYHYQIVTPESQESVGNNIPLPTTYTIKVYATKDGYEKSDLAVKEFEISAGIMGDTNNDGTIDATDIVNLVNIILKK